MAKAMAGMVLIVAASVLTAAAVTALVGWSKDLATVVVIAAVATVAGVAAVVTLER